MGNICSPLSSDLVFSVDSAFLLALGLVDPNGFGSCSAAIDFFNQENCAPSTAGLLCVLELPDEARPDKINLCAGTDIWVQDGFLDLTGIEEIKCQDETCRFLKIKNEFLLSFCPFVVNGLEESVEIKDSSFLELDLQELGLPASVEDLEALPRSVGESVFACQSAFVAGVGLIEEIKVEDGNIRRPKSTKRALRTSSHPSTRRAKPSRGSGSARAVKTSDQTLPSSSRELFAVNDRFDAALLRVWDCMGGDMNGALTFSIDDLENNKACVLNH